LRHEKNRQAQEFDYRGADSRGGSGTAALTRSGFMTVTRGPIRGRLDGNNIYLQVNWDNGSVGTYKGNVDASGNAHGITYNSTDPSSNATWKTSGDFLCIES
jgi:hypothetical protein